MKRSLTQAVLPEVCSEELDAAIWVLRRTGKIVLRMGHFELAMLVSDAIPGPRAAPTMKPRTVQVGQSLTLREEEIRDLAAQGMSGPAIAARLFIAEKSVHRHLSTVCRKLGVRGKGELEAFGAMRGVD